MEGAIWTFEGVEDMRTRACTCGEGQIQRIRKTGSSYCLPVQTPVVINDEKMIKVKAGCPFIFCLLSNFCFLQFLL